jgi:NADPH:quinone reductase-like Zn-dependent oxidoreductase
MRQDGQGLADFIRLVDREIVKPRISQVLPLTDAKRAQDLNQNGMSHGKIVLKVA